MYSWVFMSKIFSVQSQVCVKCVSGSLFLLENMMQGFVNIYLDRYFSTSVTNMTPLTLLIWLQLQRASCVCPSLSDPLWLIFFVKECITSTFSAAFMLVKTLLVATQCRYIFLLFGFSFPVICRAVHKFSACSLLELPPKAHIIILHTACSHLWYWL